MRKSPLAKTLSWVYGIIAAFTGLSVIIPIILDRRAQKRKE